MGRRYQVTAETRARVGAAANAIEAAEKIFVTLRRFREKTEAWIAAAAALRPAATPADRLRALARVAEVSAEYVEAAAAMQGITLECACVVQPQHDHPNTCARFMLDGAARYVEAFVFDRERHAWGDSWPVGDALSCLQILQPSQRGVAPRCLGDVAWSAALSWVSWIEAVDSGRATELEGLKHADIAEARRLASYDRGLKGGTSEKRKRDSDAVTANRKKLEDAERNWLSTQPQHVIDTNEQLHAAGYPGAVTLSPKPRRKP